MELDKLRTLETLRKKHQSQLEREKQYLERECQRADSWIRDLREQFKLEKEQYLERISFLESQLRRAEVSQQGAKQKRLYSANALDPSVEVQEQPGTIMALQEVHLPEVSSECCETNNLKYQSSAGEHIKSYCPSEPEHWGTPPPMVDDKGQLGEGNVTTVMQEPGPPPLLFNPHLVSCDQEEQHGQGDAPGTQVVGQTGLVQSMAQLMQAQTNMLTAHAQAVAMQSLPALPPFTGEDPKEDDDNFEKWLELLEERGRLAGWSQEQHPCQLRAHLTKTAKQIFRMLSEEERKSYDGAVKALKKRFRPIDIEELRGIEFHQKMQDSETIEQLGIDLQSLARKAFPELWEGKEFDRLLKGRFFQALLPKWQWKLGAPKPGETFAEIYDRARMLEKHERQYVASAAVRNDQKAPPSNQRVSSLDQNHRKTQHGKSRFQKHHRETTPTVTFKEDDIDDSQNTSIQRPSGTSNTHKVSSHYKNLTNWTRQSTKPQNQMKVEAAGRGKSSSTTSMITPVSTLEHMSDEQLEDILAKCRLEREQDMLKESAQVNAILAKEKTLGAAGPCIT